MFVAIKRQAAATTTHTASPFLQILSHGHHLPLHTTTNTQTILTHTHKRKGMNGVSTQKKEEDGKKSVFGWYRGSEKEN